MEKVKVVVPIYTTEFRDEELSSMQRMALVLCRHPFVLIAPEGLDTQVAEAIFSGCAVVRVSSEWLGTKNGIAGYNAMMMSRKFYDLFPHTQYILICQTDAWIFRDDLEAWCDKGYDYVGAPFPRKPLYRLWIVRGYLRLRQLCTKKILRQDLIGRAYNGGLSLRHTRHFAEACTTYRSQAEHFLASRHHRYNEDVFWSLIPKEFAYPPEREALSFSFDVKPAYCYRLTRGQLPFGCHGWFKENYKGFWQPIIESLRA